MPLAIRSSWVMRGYDSAPTRWIVRRSTNGSTSWTTVDNYLAAAGNHTTAQAVTVDNAGRIWVAGNDVRSWLVRRSDDRGASWVNSDVFLIPGRFPSASGLAADVAGNVFAAGYGATPENEVHAEFWMVRKLAAPPRLAMAAVTGSLQLTWPASATGFSGPGQQLVVARLGESPHRVMLRLIDHPPGLGHLDHRGRTLTQVERVPKSQAMAQRVLQRPVQSPAPRERASVPGAVWRGAGGRTICGGGQSRLEAAIDGGSSERGGRRSGDTRRWRRVCGGVENRSIETRPGGAGSTR